MKGRRAVGIGAEINLNPTPYIHLLSCTHLNLHLMYMHMNTAQSKREGFPRVT